MQPKKNINIAVLMTCFNRKQQSLACLEALFNQDDIDDIHLQVFLVDDGCTDGTGDTIRDQYPEVEVLQGDGTLFWNGGMRLAFSTAMKIGFDYYLWLNDDSLLYPHALQVLVETEQLVNLPANTPCIVVGSMQDLETGILTYSGNKIKAWYAPLCYERVKPRNVPVVCDAINGNCVLIPAAVSDKVGNLNKEYTHGAGDYDYSLRAKKLGFPSYIAPGFLGTCPQNPIDGTCRDKTFSLAQRKKLLERPTALPSAKEWMIFARHHAGVLWPLYWLRTTIRILSPRLWLICRGKSK